MEVNNKMGSLIENKEAKNIPGNDALYRISLLLLFLTAFLTRVAFLGYSTMIHTECENAQNTGLVMDCFKQLPLWKGLWRVWHVFPNNNNPFMQSSAFNVPISALFGLNEFSIRLNAAIGGWVSLIIIYIIFLRHTDKLTALFALILLTFNPFLISFNRFGHVDSLQTTFLLAGLLFVDRYCLSAKPRVLALFISSFLFSIAFLLKYNAVVMIAMILALYYFIFNLKLKNVFLVILLIIGFTGLLFVDQLDKLLGTIFGAFGYTKLDTEISTTNSLYQKAVHVKNDFIFYLKAHVIYFEYTVFPILTGLLFLKKIENRFFRFLVFFSIIYFLCLILLGRSFYRYLQIGTFMVTASLAFPLRRFANKKYSYAGGIFLFLFVLWTIFAHRSYISSQYHHIPHKYIAERANELNGSGHILLYGRNPETEFYFAPDGKLLYDATKDPCLEDIILIEKYPTWTTTIKKIPPSFENLSDPAISQAGDILVVTGKQMACGEPSPHLTSYDGKIRRVYRHELRAVKSFYNDFQTNDKLQKEYTLMEKVYLTNGSNELAALILRKN